MNTLTFEPTEMALSLRRIDPTKVRLIEVKSQQEGVVIQRDCYQFGDGMGIWRMEGDELLLRSIQWCRSAESTEVSVRWTPVDVELTPSYRLSIYTWPVCRPIAEPELGLPGCDEDA